MRILIVDDHQVVHLGLQQMLAEEFAEATFGHAFTAAAGMDQARSGAWDLVILDLQLPDRDGLEVLGKLKKQQATLPVLVLSMFTEMEYAIRALQVGAAGYLCKQSVASELVQAVKQAVAGGRYITPALAEALAADANQAGRVGRHEQLSQREYEVMKMIASGRSVKEIAGALDLGDKTIFTYRARLLEKLGLKSDVEVARYALQHRLVE
jgi:two-component system, NarL family, invasion response regulator UvrY